MSPRHNEIQTLESILHQLEVGFKRLISRKTECLRRLNDLKASTAILPLEIHSTIFEHACSGISHAPLLLGAVSSHWRNVAWSTPKLWTSIEVSVMTEAIKHPKRYYDLIQLYLRNAQCLPVSLKLHGAGGSVGSRRELTVPRTQLLDLIFKENLGRLRALACTGISRTLWDDICSCTSSVSLLPTLQSLDLGWSAFVPNSSQIHFMCPNLTCAKLSGQSTPIKLPWHELRHLELSGLPIDRCINLLLECPLLEEYHCDLPRWVHPSSSEFIDIFTRENVTFPKLRELYWWFVNENWTNFLMDAHFPALRHLSSLANVSDFHRSSLVPLPHHFIQNMPHLRTFDGDIRFIWRGPSLTGYTINIEDENVDEGVSGVLSADNLEELFVRNLDIDDLHFIFDQLSVIHHEAYWDSLPRLRVLFMHAPNLAKDLFQPTVFTSFVRCLRTRRTGKKVDEWKTCSRIERICLSPISSLELPEGSSEVMEEQFQELSELVHAGLQIELIDSPGTKRLWTVPSQLVAELVHAGLQIELIDSPGTKRLWTVPSRLMV